MFDIWPINEFDCISPEIKTIGCRQVNKYTSDVTDPYGKSYELGPVIGVSIHATLNIFIYGT